MNKTITDPELMLKIYEGLVRLEEKTRALVDSNQKDHDMLKAELACTREKLHKLQEKQGLLEKEGVKLSIFWKVILLTSPILITLLSQFLLKLLGL